LKNLSSQAKIYLRALSFPWLMRSAAFAIQLKVNKI
jgi:hypothetical protein